MRQRVVDEQGNRVLLAVVGKLPNIETPGLLILLPLGIALPPGTFLKIDDGERAAGPGRALRAAGLPDRAAARRRAAGPAQGRDPGDGRLPRLRRQGQRPRVDVPVSLLGFSAALAEVMK